MKASKKYFAGLVKQPPVVIDVADTNEGSRGPTPSPSTAVNTPAASVAPSPAASPAPADDNNSSEANKMAED